MSTMQRLLDTLNSAQRRRWERDRGLYLPVSVAVSILRRLFPQRRWPCTNTTLKLLRSKLSPTLPGSKRRNYTTLPRLLGLLLKHYRPGKRRGCLV